MDMVERVDAEEAFMAAVWDALKGDHSDLTRQAIILRAHRAAIRAMLEGQEPVAWTFRGPNGEFELHTCSSWPEPTPDGWTETPLYDLSALKEVVG